MAYKMVTCAKENKIQMYVRNVEGNFRKHGQRFPYWKGSIWVKIWKNDMEPAKWVPNERTFQVQKSASTKSEVGVCLLDQQEAKHVSWRQKEDKQWGWGSRTHRLLGSLWQTCKCGTFTPGGYGESRIKGMRCGMLQWLLTDAPSKDSQETARIQINCSGLNQVVTAKKVVSGQARMCLRWRQDAESET